jgi:hypothetical protein
LGGKAKFSSLISQRDIATFVDRQKSCWEKKQLVRSAQQMRCDSLDAAMRWKKVRNLFAANETRLLAERLRIVISMVSHVMSLACIAFERFVSRK